MRSPNWRTMASPAMRASPPPPPPHRWTAGPSHSADREPACPGRCAACRPVSSPDCRERQRAGLPAAPARRKPPEPRCRQLSGSATSTCGSGRKPRGNSPRSRTSCGDISARLGQVTPWARTPPCTARRCGSGVGGIGPCCIFGPVFRKVDRWEMSSTVGLVLTRSIGSWRTTLAARPSHGARSRQPAARPVRMTQNRTRARDPRANAVTALNPVSLTLSTIHRDGRRMVDGDGQCSGVTAQGSYGMPACKPVKPLIG
jgi:hypothetical protein